MIGNGEVALFLHSREPFCVYNAKLNLEGSHELFGNAGGVLYQTMSKDIIVTREKFYAVCANEEFAHQPQMPQKYP